MLLMYCPSLLAQSANREILAELDRTISRKNVYRIQLQKDISVLEYQFYSANTYDEKFDICEKIFKKYLRFQVDSALAHVNQLEGLLPYIRRDRNKATALVRLNRVAVYGLLGMYSEEKDILKTIRPKTLDAPLLHDYYAAYRALYGWQSEFIGDKSMRNTYFQKSNAYRDSLLSVPANVNDMNVTLARKYIIIGLPNKALTLLTALLKNKLDEGQKANLYYMLSEAYGALNMKDKQIYYLAESGIADISNGVREYASLLRLSYLLYQMGDINRAYNYMNCSLDDALKCNANLRFLEISHIYPIIQHANMLKMNRLSTIRTAFIILTAVFFFTLLALVLHLYFSKRKVASINASLDAMKDKLQVANDDLKKSNNIKEVYLGKYLSKCVKYLNNLDDYRKSLVKLAMKSQTEDLFTKIKSNQFILDERKNFYNEFDKSFLELFPNFVNDFNKLVIPEARIQIKSNELLTTELRIFALIRLGVTDSNEIAGFLGYSITTIYSYRSRMHKNAIGSDKDFEIEVMKL
jgi:hypothetical protein